MAKDNELIVVGMRYQSGYNRANYSPGCKVTVRAEPNNTVNKDALAVYIQGSPADPFVKAGYIRDQDISKANALYNKGKRNPFLDIYLEMQVVSIYTHYIVIALVEPPRLEPAPPSDVISSLNINTYESYVTSSTNQSTLQSEIKKTLESNKMTFNTSNLKDSFFREVKNVSFDIQSGKLGVKSKNGITVYAKDGVSVNPITEMGFDMPAFAMRVPVADLKEGDILIGNGDPVFFKEFYVDTKDQTTGYQTVSLDGAIQEVGVVTNMFFGKNTVLAVKNMFGEGSSEGMNPMALMAMSGMLNGGSDSKMDPLMLMMMCGGFGGSGGTQMNPMMLAMMMSKK